jgi:glycosyltransferase involved in cell wall biosynthesis
MRILFLTLAGIDDRSFGGAMRGNDIRDALGQIGEVDTLVIHGAAQFRLDRDWDDRRVRHATFDRFGLSFAALAQRWRVRAWVAAMLRSNHYDVIVARYLGLALFVPFGAWTRLVLDADDILKTAPSGVPVSSLRRLKLALRNAVARHLMRRAQHVWFVNPLDGARLSTRRASWLPNAIRVPAPDRPRAAAQPGRLLMVGYFEHPPNLQGLRWFIDQVLPALAAAIPGVELQIVGRHPADFGADFSGPVRIQGFVDDLAIEYDRATLVIAPIMSGGGTQIKVIEALAHGRPLVASAFAHAGFAAELHHAAHLRVAMDSADWIVQCTAALRSGEEAEAMGRRGYGAVRERYGVDRMVMTVRETLLTLDPHPRI